MVSRLHMTWPLVHLVNKPSDPCRTSSFKAAVVDSKVFPHKLQLLAEMFPGIKHVLDHNLGCLAEQSGKLMISSIDLFHVHAHQVQVSEYTRALPARCDPSSLPKTRR